LNKSEPSKRKKIKTNQIIDSLTIVGEGSGTNIFSASYESEYPEDEKPLVKVEIDDGLEFQQSDESAEVSNAKDYSLINSVISEDDEENTDYQWNISSESLNEMYGSVDYVKRKSAISISPEGRSASTKNKTNSNYNCKHCEYITSEKSQVIKHVAITHKKVKSKVHKCKYCSYFCDDLGVIKDHIKENHSDLKPYSCDLCPFKAKDKRALDHHVVSNHDQSKAYLCEHCSYSTPSKGRLTCHIKAVHDKFKPFICEHCSFATAAKAHLDNHIAVVHNKIKPFKCTQCPYRAANNRDMKRHIKEVHEKVRPFSCHLCPYKAGRRVLMTKHMTKMHNENKLPTRKVKYDKISNPNSNLGYYKNKVDYDLPEFKNDSLPFQSNS